MPPVRTPASVGVSRAIAGALIAGVTTFALVAWFIVQEGGPIGDPELAAEPMFYAWLAVAFGSLMAALFLWRGRVTPRIERPRAPDRDTAEAHDEALQTSLIIVWALMEGPALFGVVVYLLFGSIFAFAGGLLLVWLGIGVTFPRGHWFAAKQRSDGP